MKEITQVRWMLLIAVLILTCPESFEPIVKIIGLPIFSILGILSLSKDKGE